MIFSVSKPADVEEARAKYYDTLADYFLKQVSLRRVNRIVEAGTGKGQLTIPLLEKLPRRISLIAVDLSRGPYTGSFETLQSRLQQGRNEARVHLVRSDVRSIKKVADNSVDLVFSNELLCDMKTESQIAQAFKEFWRILRPGRTMVHGECSSSPANKAQAIAIKADSPEGTNTPSRFWNPDELYYLSRAANFQHVSVSYFQTTVSFGYEAAVAELRNWGVKESFLKRNDRLLRRYGIQLPYEHLITCQKPA